MDVFFLLAVLIQAFILKLFVGSFDCIQIAMMTYMCSIALKPTNVIDKTHMSNYFK